MLVGDSECATEPIKESAPSTLEAEEETNLRQRKSHNIGHVAIATAQNFIQPVTSWLKQCPSHRLCNHKHSCSYHVIQVQYKFHLVKTCTSKNASKIKDVTILTKKSGHLYFVIIYSI